MKLLHVSSTSWSPSPTLEWRRLTDVLHLRGTYEHARGTQIRSWWIEGQGDYVRWACRSSLPSRYDLEYGGMISMSSHRFPVDRMVGSKLPVRVVNAWSRETECLETDFSTKLSEILCHVLIFVFPIGSDLFIRFCPSTVIKSGAPIVALYTEADS